VQRQVAGRVSDLLAQGVIRPLTSNLFDMNYATSALRFMSGARYTGKVVTRTSNASEDGVCGSYLVTGGLGALGQVTGKWLISEKTPTIYLVGRTGKCSEGNARIAQDDILGGVSMVSQFMYDSSVQRALRGSLVMRCPSSVSSTRLVF